VSGKAVGADRRREQSWQPPRRRRPQSGLPETQRAPPRPMIARIALGAGVRAAGSEPGLGILPILRQIDCDHRRRHLQAAVEQTHESSQLARCIDLVPPTRHPEIEPDPVWLNVADQAHTLKRSLCHTCPGARRARATDVFRRDLDHHRWHEPFRSSPATVSSLGSLGAASPRPTRQRQVLGYSGPAGPRLLRALHFGYGLVTLSGAKG